MPEFCIFPSETSDLWRLCSCMASVLCFSIFAAFFVFVCLWFLCFFLNGTNCQSAEDVSSDVFGLFIYFLKVGLVILL